MVAKNQNLPGAGSRAVDAEDARFQEQAFAIVMAVVPTTFVALTVLLVVMMQH